MLIKMEILEDKMRNVHYVINDYEIDLLQKYCYALSSSCFPLSSLFNVIRDSQSVTCNKNQAYKDLFLIVIVLVEQKRQLRALEIINEKRVNIVELLYFSNSVDEYNEFAKSCLSLKVKQLTQEEFDLLKEVLLWIKAQKK